MKNLMSIALAIIFSLFTFSKLSSQCNCPPGMTQIIIDDPVQTSTLTSSLPSSSYSNTCFILNDQLLIDNNMTFNDCHFILMQEQGITQHLGDATFTNCEFEGCGATFLLQLRFANANTDITGCNFYNSGGIGILMNENNINLYFHTNTFNSNPYAIWLGPNLYGVYNLMNSHYIGNGIGIHHASNAHLEITESTFANNNISILSAGSDNISDCFFNSDTVANVYLQGGSHNVAYNDFWSTPRVIELVLGSLNAHDNEIVSCNNGIRASMFGGQTIQIRNNQVSFFNVGIEINGNFDAPVYVEDNSVFDVHTQIGPSTAIYFRNSLGILNTFDRIIRNNTIGMSSNCGGIYLLDMENTFVEGNEITSNYDAINSYGVLVKRGEYNHVIGNTISAKAFVLPGSDPPTHATSFKGVTADLSSDIEIGENECVNNKIGIEVFGNCGSNCDIYCNEFLGAGSSYGFYYHFGAVTGDQVHKGNRFYTSFHGADVRHDGNDSNISASIYESEITATYFPANIMTPNASGSICWWCPVAPPSERLDCDTPPEPYTSAQTLEGLDNKKLDFQDFDSDGIVLYPNPVIGRKFTIKAQGWSINEVKLYSLDGNEIFADIHAELDSGFNVIVPNTIQGIFIVKILGQDGKTTFHKVLVN